VWIDRSLLQVLDCVSALTPGSCVTLTPIIPRGPQRRPTSPIYGSGLADEKRATAAEEGNEQSGDARYRTCKGPSPSHTAPLSYSKIPIGSRLQTRGEGGRDASASTSNFSRRGDQLIDHDYGRDSSAPSATTRGLEMIFAGWATRIR